MVSALPISMVVAPKTEVVPIFPLRVIAPLPADSFILMAAKSVDVVPPILPPIPTVPEPVLIVKLRAVASELIVELKSRLPPFEVMVELASRTTAPSISISVVEASKAVAVVLIPPLRLIVPPVNLTSPISPSIARPAKSRLILHYRHLYQYLLIY